MTGYAGWGDSHLPKLSTRGNARWALGGEPRTFSLDVNDRIRVARDAWIMRHQPQRLSNGLGDENAVERILMMWWQRLDRGRVSCGHGEQLVACAVKEIQRFTCRDRHFAASE